MSQEMPLAERLRPETLETFVGQQHLKKRIQAILEAPRLPSMLLFGPPGCGKSTLALLLARSRSDHWLRLSAPEAGLSQLRKRLNGVEILVLDELHRFSKAQQDFFLPIIENGEMTLIATTTENPSFSVTRQLLSRLHLMRLAPIGQTEMEILLKRGLEAADRRLPADASAFLLSLANGDARTLLNLVEYVTGLPEESLALSSLKILLPDVVLRHDKDGDSHYELASALIKSIRGSDPDAALYYLACLLESGEDPRFICRRLILSASEDVGLADPAALQMAVACQQSVEFVGMPEGFIPLAEAVTYLALAPKSNSAYKAYLNAAREIKQHSPRPVPLHLRNASTGLQKSWGYGRDYKYPHNYPNAWVEQDYLPEELKGQRFYAPKETGQEARLVAAWKRFTRPRRAPEQGGSGYGN